MLGEMSNGRERPTPPEGSIAETFMIPISKESELLTLFKG